MTKQDAVAILERTGTDYDSNASAADLKELATQALADEAQSQANGGADAPSPVDRLAAIRAMGRAPAFRLDQASFDGIEVGTEFPVKVRGFRQSMNKDYWIGTFSFGSLGTVTSVIGDKEDYSMGELLVLKGSDVTLTYTGSRPVATRSGAPLELPSFRLEF